MIRPLRQEGNTGTSIDQFLKWLFKLAVYYRIFPPHSSSPFLQSSIPCWTFCSHVLVSFFIIYYNALSIRSTGSSRIVLIAALMVREKFYNPKNVTILQSAICRQSQFATASGSAQSTSAAKATCSDSDDKPSEKTVNDKASQARNSSAETATVTVSTTKQCSSRYCLWQRWSKSIIRTLFWTFV